MRVSKLKINLRKLAKEHGFNLEEPGMIILENKDKERLVINVWDGQRGYSVTQISYAGKKHSTFDFSYLDEGFSFFKEKPEIEEHVDEEPKTDGPAYDIWEIINKGCYTSDWELLEFCGSDGTPYADTMGQSIVEVEFSTMGMNIFRGSGIRVRDYRYFED